MANEKSKRKFDLKETKGSFEIVGKTSDTKSDRFFTENTFTTKTGGKMPTRNINFGLVFDDNLEGTQKKKTYISLRGSERDKVFVSKRVTEDGKSFNKTKELSWKNRYDIPEGYGAIGIRLGIEKQLGEDGKLTNVKKNLYEYDACAEINEKIMDDQSVYIRGNIQCYTSSKGEHRQQFMLNQISLLSNEIEFNDEYKPRNNFKQPICFKSIAKNPEVDGEYIINGYVISYSSVDEIEMITRNENLAKKMKKALKPYSYIELWGNIECISNVETVSEDDVWGEECEMDKQSSPSRIVLLVTGAQPASIDDTLYSEDAINSALAAIKQSKSAEKDYGKNVSDKDAGFEGDWGSVGGDDDEDDWA